MSIDIASYISKVETIMGEMCNKAQKEGYLVGQISLKHQKEILLSGAFDASIELAKEIYEEARINRNC